jgi:toxin secretion/phage lysis holin
VLIAHRLDILLATDYIRTTAIIGFIANEAISIIENAGLMGVPLPGVVTKAIEILKHKGDGEK